MSWRDVLTPSYRPRPLHSTSSSRECISLRSSYTPSSSLSTSISSSRAPTALRRRASETVVSTPSLSSYSVSSYSRYRPTGGTLIDLPTVDPYDLPRRYRSSYDRDDYKRSDYATRSDYSTPEYSRQDSVDRYRDRTYSIEKTTEYSTERRNRSYSIDKKEDRYGYRDSKENKLKEETSAVDVALRRSEESSETSFEIVVIKKEWTIVEKSVRETRKVKKTIKAPEKILEEKEKTEKEEEVVSSYQDVLTAVPVPHGTVVVEDMTVPLPSAELLQHADVSQIAIETTEKADEYGMKIAVNDEVMEIDAVVEAPTKKKITRKKTARRTVPVLPDVVMRKVFSSLTYRELCKTEVTCKKWQMLIIDLLRRDIHEITIEKLGSSQIVVVHQPPFRRLNITCPADSYDFLSGVVRRSRLAALKLTTDLHFLSNMDKLSIDLDSSRLRKYFSNVDDLWLIIVSISEEEVEGFERMAEFLFNQLSNVTVQCHVHEKTSTMIACCIKSLTRWYMDTDLSVEIHADTAEAVYHQLSALADLNLYKLKIICTEFDSPELNITGISTLLANNHIRTKILTFRDWSISCDSSSLLTSHPMETLRISSCDILTVDDFLKAMIATEKQDAPDPKKARIASKEDLKPSRKRKLPFIKRFEIAGQCRLRGLEFLTNKAHKELEKMLNTHFPLMEVDYSEIYYFE